MLVAGGYRRYVTLLLIVLGCAGAGPGSNQRVTGKIAFGVGYYWGIYTFNLDNREIKKIDVGEHVIIGGDLAYNAKRNLLAFEEIHDDIPSIYVYDFSTKQKRLLYKGTTLDNMRYRPTFHPDGEHLFLINLEAGVFEHEVATGRWREILITGTEESKFQQISFSRTGKLVALTSAHFDAVFIGKTEGSRIVIERRILEDFAYVISPKWIGDDEIVFAGHKPGRANRLWKISLVDQSVVQLSHDTVPRGTRDPCVSPDGKWIVFKSGRGPADDDKGRIGLWMMSIDGRILEQLTVERALFRGHSSPVWIE